MNIKRAHEHIDRAIACLDWFAPDEFVRACGFVLAAAKSAPDAEIARGLLRMAFDAWPAGPRSDEASVTLKYIEGALAEYEYQIQKSAAA